jgi:glycosyltransferase involved in cell wall biosynthesis
MSRHSSATALFFHSDAIEGEGRDLVGRRSSGQSFLGGYLDHAADGDVQVLTQKKSDIEAFHAIARDMGSESPIDGLTLRGKDDFTRFGTVFFPGPGYLDAAWRRQQFDVLACSLVGVTHTVSTKRVMDRLFHLMLQPIMPWDAIICTSRAVKSVVQTQMDQQVAYITSRFGAAHVQTPQLPVIPLGIHADDFAHKPDARAAMRGTHGASDDTVVVMSMGRLTVVEKANPVPLFIALEEIAQATGKDIQLWMVGWASTPDEHRMHVDGAKAFCPSVTVHVIDGRDAEVRRDIWSGADVFTLPVDNIQETFGLVPVEAMAAGLPVVMPDWDGFRDTVIHGETGFLIPTMMAGAGGIGRDLARRFADGTDGYLQYLMMIEQQTVIDMRAYVAALTDLITNPDLRKRMGQAGVRHVKAHLDWKAVMPQYQGLADALADMRAGADQQRPKITNPTEIDPFALYSSYPTQSAPTSISVTHRKTLTAEGLNALDAANGRSLYRRKLLPDAQTLKIAQTVAEAGTIDAANVAQAISLPLEVTVGTLLFLAKYDFLTIEGLEQNTARIR